MAVVFPNDDEFLALTRDGVPYSNPAGNESPGYVDIVGTTEYPAIYFATNDTDAFFRFRIAGDPRFGGGFVNSSWVVLFDTDMNLTNSYGWELALNGNFDRVELIQNTKKNFPGPGFVDTAEGTPILFPVTAYDIARAIPAGSSLGGGTDYFVDFSINLATLKSTLGVGDDEPLRFNYFTATNPNNFNKDKNCPINQFDACFSDYVLLSTGLTGTVVNKEDGTPVCNAKVELFLDGVSAAETLTDDYGNYAFMDLDAGEYKIQITKCCYLPLCNCSTFDLVKNKITVLNFSLNPDCVCEIKCNILETEEELAAEKERLYKKLTDYFNSITFNEENIWQYTQFLCMLNCGTAELDCCISEVIEQLNTCEEGG